jgi:hypothetical protein
MNTIVLHLKNGSSLEAPISIEFQGSQAGGTTVWIEDEEGVKSSFCIKESPDEIMQIINKTANQSEL